MDKENLARQVIIRDYKLPFGHLENLIRRRNNKESPRWIKLAERSFLHRPFLKYEEYIDPEDHDNLLTKENEEVVKELNSIVDLLNKMRVKKNTDHEQLTRIWNQLREIIFRN